MELRDLLRNWSVPSTEASRSLAECHQEVTEKFQKMRSERDGLVAQGNDGLEEAATLQAEIAWRHRRLEELSTSIDELKEERERHDRALEKMEADLAAFADSQKNLVHVVRGHRG